MKILLTALLDQKDVAAFAQASNQALPARYPVFSSTVEETDETTLAGVLADHARKLARYGTGKAEER